MAQIQIRDPEGLPVAGVNIRLSLGEASSDHAIFDIVSDNEGNQSWPVPFWPQGFYTLHVNMRDANGSRLKFDPRFAEAHIPVQPGDRDVVILLERATGGDEQPAGSVEALVGIDSSAHRFVTASGRKQFLRGVTSYLIYKRFLDGEDLRPLLSQLQGLGCNMVRLFGMVTSFAHWHPQEYGDRYYDAIPDFMALADSFGQYVLWTPCADTQQIMPREWLRHMGRSLERLQPSRNKLVSFVNEQGQHENGIYRQLAYNDLRARGLLDGLMFDTGSFGEDAPCEAPFGTHVVLHVRRAYPSHVKDCCTLDHPNRVNAPHLEVLLDEPDRYGEGGNMNLEQARDSAATSYCSLGFVLHTSQGVQSQPFSGRTLEIAAAVFPILKLF